MTLRTLRRSLAAAGLFALPVIALAAPLTSADTNGDGKISRAEAIAAQDKAFKRLDSNGNGTLSRKEFDAGQPGLPKDATSVDRKQRKEIVNRWFDQIDKNHDGKITRAEYRAAVMPYFNRLDTNHDGYISRKELEDSMEQAGKAQHELESRQQGKSGQ